MRAIIVFFGILIFNQVYPGVVNQNDFQDLYYYVGVLMLALVIDIAYLIKKKK